MAKSEIPTCPRILIFAGSLSFENNTETRLGFLSASML